MTKVGHLKPNGRENGYAGHFETLTLAIPIELVRADGGPDTAAPSHRITTRTQNGVTVEIGSAWTKTLQRGDRAGEPFLSLSIDDPSFSHPLNVAAFKTKDGGGYDIVFRRRQDAA